MSWERMAEPGAEIEEVPRHTVEVRLAEVSQLTRARTWAFLEKGPESSD
jgi:hypothetical protein